MAVDMQTVATDDTRVAPGERHGGREVPDDYPLIENGVLTSLQTVALVAWAS